MLCPCGFVDDFISSQNKRQLVRHRGPSVPSPFSNCICVMTSFVHTCFVLVFQLVTNASYLRDIKAVAVVLFPVFKK